MARIRRILTLPSVENSIPRRSVSDGRQRPAITRVTGDKRQWQPEWGTPPWNQPTR